MFNQNAKQIKKQFYARGKLLLTGEYAVLHGALSIALPTKFGQRMTVKNARGSDLIWEALDDKGEVWFDAQISLYDFSAIKTSDAVIAKKLKKILRAAVRENSEFLSTWSGFNVETQLEFPLEWGLGSSSTLIYNIAQWAEVNPFHLYFDISNGSGYDIACAEADEAIHYQLGEENLNFNEIDFNLPFLKNLYFIYQGKKQDSETAIKLHGKKFRNNKSLIEQITRISQEITSVKSLAKFNSLIEEHESIIGDALGISPIKASDFSDFEGSIKSLGAWGGDFILASTENPKDYVINYFKSKNLDVIFPYNQLIYGA